MQGSQDAIEVEFQNVDWFLRLRPRFGHGLNGYRDHGQGK